MHPAAASKVKPPPRIRMDSFPVGSELMNTLMKAVVAEVNKSPVLRERLFQVGAPKVMLRDPHLPLLLAPRLCGHAVSCACQDLQGSVGGGQESLRHR